MECVFESDFEKGVFVMVLVSIRTRIKCYFENSSKRCLWNEFLKLILKRYLCNDSRFYKNAYKVLFGKYFKEVFVECVFERAFEKVSF